MRYDIDGSGTINSEQEFKQVQYPKRHFDKLFLLQLTINVLVKLKVAVKDLSAVTNFVVRCWRAFGY